MTSETLGGTATGNQDGVITNDLVPLAALAHALRRLAQIYRGHGAALMGILDACNRRFGRGAVVPGSNGFAPKGEWLAKFGIRSPRYPTPIVEVPVVLVV